MADLFEDNGAIFSECGKYRYALWRIWDKEKKPVMFIGLNPSTADESKDDPTIRRVKRISYNLGYGGIYMMNLFAWITPYPDELRECADPVGENDKWLNEIKAKCGNDIIFSWGSFPEAFDRAKKVMSIFLEGKALIINSDGSPRHPLYVRNDIKPVEFKINNYGRICKNSQGNA
jgi:hypothetical protein